MIRPSYQKSQFYHWTEIKVRFRDLDPLNHVNNAVFNTYFEEARIDFIRAIPEFNKSMQQGFSFVLVHMEMDYLKPVLLEETLLVGSSVEEYGNSSINGIQAIYDKKNHALKAVAKTTGVWYNLTKQRPARLPELPDKNKYLFKNTNNG
jgi:acyl-CoA thioester hydrolase